MLMKIARIENMKNYQGDLRLNKNLYLLQEYKVRTLIMIAIRWTILKLKKNYFLKNLATVQIQKKVILHFNMKTPFTNFEIFRIPLLSKQLKMNSNIEETNKRKIMQLKISNQ